MLGVRQWRIRVVGIDNTIGYSPLPNQVCDVINADSRSNACPTTGNALTNNGGLFFAGHHLAREADAKDNEEETNDCAERRHRLAGLTLIRAIRVQ